MNDHISIPPTAADAYRAMLAEQTYASLEEAPVLTEGNMTLSLSNTDKANKFKVRCKLQYEKYGTTITDTFKNRQAAEKFAKMAGSHVLTQTTSEENEEIVALAKKQKQGKDFGQTVKVMYPIDGHKTEFDVHKVYGNRNKVEYMVQNPSSIGGASPKNVFDSAEAAADAIEKAGGKRPKIVKA
jgi:hypothetical protein